MELSIILWGVVEDVAREASCTPGMHEGRDRNDEDFIAPWKDSGFAPGPPLEGPSLHPLPLACLMRAMPGVTTGIPAHECAEFAVRSQRSSQTDLRYSLVNTVQKTPDPVVKRKLFTLHKEYSDTFVLVQETREDLSFISVGGHHSVTFGGSKLLGGPPCDL